MKLVFSLPLKLLSGKEKKKNWLFLGLGNGIGYLLIKFQLVVPRLVTVITLLAFHAWQG